MSDAAAARGLVDADDATLVAACRAGEADAWEAVVRRYGALVYTVARRAGLHEDDAADVFQTVWRIAVEDMDRVRDARRIGTWLARTAHFQAMRLRRNLGITRRVLGGMAANDVSLEEPAEALERCEDRERVHRALAGVDARCRELLRALYFEQPVPSYADVAGRLDMRVGSVGPTRARCLQRLEGELSRGDHAPQA